MVLPTTGPLSLNDIQTEFGGTNPIGLNEYYGAASGIPASGTISIGDFYGAASGPSMPSALVDITPTNFYNRGSGFHFGNDSYCVSLSDLTYAYTTNGGSSWTYPSVAGNLGYSRLIDGGARAVSDNNGWAVGGYSARSGRTTFRSIGSFNISTGAFGTFQGLAATPIVSVNTSTGYVFVAPYSYLVNAPNAPVNLGSLALSSLSGDGYNSNITIVSGTTLYRSTNAGSSFSTYTFPMPSGFTLIYVFVAKDGSGNGLVTVQNGATTEQGMIPFSNYGTSFGSYVSSGSYDLNSTKNSPAAIMSDKNGYWYWLKRTGLQGSYLWSVMFSPTFYLAGDATVIGYLNNGNTTTNAYADNRQTLSAMTTQYDGYPLVHDITQTKLYKIV